MFRVAPKEPRTIRWWFQNRAEIDMEPSYQRKGGIWSTEDKQLLIDSILNEYDVPKFYLSDFGVYPSNLNATNKQYAVIDGKQRLEAIYQFRSGELTLANSFVWTKNEQLKLEGLTFQDLQRLFPEVAEAFDDYYISVIIITTDDLSRINDQFIRLNRSKPLSGAEIRSAFTGRVSSVITELVKHPFFDECIKFSVARKQDHNLAAKLLLMEFAGRPTETKKKNLDAFAKMSEDALTDNLDPATTAVSLQLDRLRRIFVANDSLLTSAGALPGYYWFIRGLDNESLSFVRPFLVGFEKLRNESRQSMKSIDIASTSNPDDLNAELDLTIYNTVLRSVDDASSISKRALILKERFNQFYRAHRV